MFALNQSMCLYVQPGLWLFKACNPIWPRQVQLQPFERLRFAARKEHLSHTMRVDRCQWLSAHTWRKKQKQSQHTDTGPNREQGRHADKDGKERKREKARGKERERE